MWQKLLFDCTNLVGEVSAARDNGVCGVGVAYDSMIAGQLIKGLYGIFSISNIGFLWPFMKFYRIGGFFSEMLFFS